MMLGGIAALVGSISSPGVVGRRTVSNEGPVLLGGLGTFVIGFMAWLVCKRPRARDHQWRRCPSVPKSITTEP